MPTATFINKKLRYVFHDKADVNSELVPREYAWLQELFDGREGSYQPLLSVTLTARDLNRWRMAWRAVKRMKDAMADENNGTPTENPSDQENHQENNQHQRTVQQQTQTKQNTW